MWERISYLVCCNDGFVVSSWGVTEYTNGHQHGLLQDEAIELIYFEGFMNGVYEACKECFSPYEVFFVYYNKYRKDNGLEELVWNGL
jgi:hypothetical protein